MATPSAHAAPGPSGHWVVGNLPEFARDLLGFLQDCARRYGDVVSLRLGGFPTVFLNHPDLVEDVLVTRNADFVKHSFFWRNVTGIFGNGLLTSEGDFWLRQRRLAQPAFHRERVASYGTAMVAETQEMLDGWGADEERDVHEEMMGLTMRIVTRTLFGTDVDAHVREVGDAFDVAVRQIAIRFRRPFFVPDWVPLPSNRAYLRAVRRLDALVYPMIRARRQAPADTSDDLLGMLLAARDEDGSGMTERQLRDEAITIFLAGHETTAIALSWAFALLAGRPEAEEALRAEVEAVLGGRPPAVSDLPLLRVAEAVVCESLRLYPPAYVFGREARREGAIGSYPLPTGTTVLVSPYVMHRDPRFFDRPEEFDPGRWLDGLSRRLPRFAYFPFGGGPRLCIGNAFAMMEATLILAAIVQRYRLTLVPGHPLETLPSITLRPRHGVRMRLVRRA